MEIAADFTNWRFEYRQLVTLEYDPLDKWVCLSIDDRFVDCGGVLEKTNDDWYWGIQISYISLLKNSKPKRREEKYKYDDNTLMIVWS